MVYAWLLLHVGPVHYVQAAQASLNICMQMWCTSYIFALFFRGQESAGIVSSQGHDAYSFAQHKGMGLVSQVFKDEEIRKLKGNLAIGKDTLFGTNHSFYLRLSSRISTSQCKLYHNINSIISLINQSLSLSLPFFSCYCDPVIRDFRPNRPMFAQWFIKMNWLISLQISGSVY